MSEKSVKYVQREKLEKRDPKAILYNILTVVVSAVLLFPLYWMIVTSLKLEADIFKSPPSLFPETLNFNTYLTQLNGTDYNMLQVFPK